MSVCLFAKLSAVCFTPPIGYQISGGGGIVLIHQSVTSLIEATFGNSHTQKTGENYQLPHSTASLLVQNYFESKSDAAEYVKLTWKVFVKTRRSCLVVKPLNLLAG